MSQGSQHDATIERMHFIGAKTDKQLQEILISHLNRKAVLDKYSIERDVLISDINIIDMEIFRRGREKAA